MDDGVGAAVSFGGAVVKSWDTVGDDCSLIDEVAVVFIPFWCVEFDFKTDHLDGSICDAGLSPAGRSSGLTVVVVVVYRKLADCQGRL